MSKNLQDLLKLARRLRAPDGCPWDQKQTIPSLFKHLQDEVQEIGEAIEKEDNENLKEELGDVLFQLVMIIQIAEEAGYFKLADVIKDIDHKIISRHTWVFGDDKAETAEEALELWKRNKKK